MQIILNGNPHEIAQSMTLTALLADIGLGGKPVVVELDQQAVFPRDYPEVTFTDGAKVEIVMLAAGG
jgi:sulfur carrier protein